MADLQNTVTEEREELMVSPFDHDSEPTMLKAHFLKPSANFTNTSTFHLPKPSPPSPPLQVSYHGWANPTRNWLKWVDRMVEKHKETWEEAGIYEAIMNCKVKIHKDENFLLALAEKWNAETNTFVFPWGEPTITLEDMYVLGGYSILGDSVLRPVTTVEMKETEGKLMDGRWKLVRSSSRKASHGGWNLLFTGEESDVEHEAFLALWLSRFVFPETVDSIRTDVFSISVCLARGIRIALAPAVLAQLYEGLSCLKKKIVECINLGSTAGESISIWAQFQLVQIWGWERFVTIRPNPNSKCEPRWAQWDQVMNVTEIEHVRLLLDNGRESFQWRPYVSNENDGVVFYHFYGVREESELDKNHTLHLELQSFARCLRACQILGIKCMEWYLPHRVSMQFGFDQDIPGEATLLNENLEIAWSTYSWPINVAKLYIPPPCRKTRVTPRYLDWLKQLRCSALLGSGNILNLDQIPSDPYPVYSHEGKNMEDVSSDSEDGKTLASIFGSRKLKLKRVKKRKSTDVQMSSGGTSHQNRLTVVSVPPGFPPKYNDGVADVAIEKDKSMLRKLSEFNEKLGGVVVVESSGDCSKASLNSLCQLHLSSCSENNLSVNVEQVPDSIDSGEPAIGNSAVEMNLSKMPSKDSTEKNKTSPMGNRGAENSFLELEQRIVGLENLLAKVKRRFVERGLIVR